MILVCNVICVFFFKQKTAYEMRISDWSSDVCSSDLIQARMVARRVAAGETIVGKKIGVTSKAIQDAIGVFEPDFGQLTSGMAYEDGATVDLDALIQPKAEAEIAFVLKHDLIGPGVTAADVLKATDHVRACFEIVDSRVTGCARQSTRLNSSH